MLRTISACMQIIAYLGPVQKAAKEVWRPATERALFREVWLEYEHHRPHLDPVARCSNPDLSTSAHLALGPDWAPSMEPHEWQDCVWTRSEWELGWELHRMMHRTSFPIAVLR